MRVQLECTYCGHVWEETIYNQGMLQGKTCTHGNCKHKKLVVRDLTTNKIDYYQGCPPFPVKEKNWNGMY